MSQKITLEVPPARYPTFTIARIIEEVLRATNERDSQDWLVNVEQKNDRTLEIGMMLVG